MTTPQTSELDDETANPDIPYSSPPWALWARRPTLEASALLDLTSNICGNDLDAASSAVGRLAKCALSKQQAANLRLAGAVPRIVALLDNSSGANDKTRTQAAAVLEMVAWCDVGSRDPLVQLGIVRRLLAIMDAGSYSDNWHMVFQALKTLTPLTYTGDLGLRKLDVYKAMSEGVSFRNMQ